MRILFLLVTALALMVGAASAQDTAVLEFRANGEGFVREGFVSKDGWAIAFDQVVVSIAEVRAFQTTPPYDAFAGELTRAQVMVGLEGQFSIDLAAGDESAEPILVGTVADAPAGYYNALSWVMEPAASGDNAGFSLVIDGMAEKEGAIVDFRIRIEESYRYSCGAFVGDERKGVLQAGTAGDVELTFHFDHIFGDAETPMDDSLNTGAPGFDGFAALAVDGVVDVTLADLEMMWSPEAYQQLVDVLPSLGHVGEGHCHES